MVAVGAEFAPGDIVGNTYEVIDYIGRGAMGYVYHVRHVNLPKEYALKTLSTSQITETAWLRFQIEAQSIAKMFHPNIITIHNFALHRGPNRVEQPFYVMDLLAGHSLMEELRDNDPLSLARALSVFSQAASGIGYAHSKGIIHRDIKPGNIMLLAQPDASGASVKIVDFGIAKLTADSDIAQQYLTSAGEVFGSPFYMSPEQGLGQPVDARSDVYSLGVTFFEALTGDLPFKANSAVDIMLLHQVAPVPKLNSIEGAGEFPAVVQYVIDHMLAKDPGQRYQNMQEVVADLTAIQMGKPPSSILRVQGLDSGNVAETKRSETQDAALDLDAKPVHSPQMSKAQVLLLAVAAAAVVIVTVAFLASRSKSAKPQADSGRSAVVAEKDAPSLSPGPGKGHDSKSGDAKNKPKLDLEEDKEPGDSLKSTKPFGVLHKGGTTVDFDFPKDVLIGKIYCYNVASGAEKTEKAKGHLFYGANDWIAFQPSRIIGKYPQYLKRFHAGELSAVQLVNNSDSDAILEACTAIPGIDYLIIQNTQHLTDKCVASLNKFRALKTFDGSGSSLDGIALAQATCWDKIETFSCSKANNITPMLYKLRGSKNLRYLDVHESNLTYQDYKAISELVSLRELKFENDPVTLNELKLLASLPKLEKIELSDCDLKEKAIPILRQFKSLKELQMGTPKTLASLREKFRSGLPGVVVQ